MNSHFFYSIDKLRTLSKRKYVEGLPYSSFPLRNFTCPFITMC